MFVKVLVTVVLFLAVANCKQIVIKNTGRLSLSVSINSETLVIPAFRSSIQQVADQGNVEISAVRADCNLECTGPRTVANLQIRSNDLDSYGVSLVNGFNIPIKIVPVRESRCRAAVCKAKINKLCPEPQQVLNAGGEVVACKNTPLLFQKVCPKAVLDSSEVNEHCQADSYIVLLN